MSIELVMPSNHLILCCPLLLLPSIFPSIKFFSNESVLHIRWPKYWSFSFSISSAAAATAAKWPQSCLTLCDPTDGSPPGSPIPGILQARILEWVAISFSTAWKRKVKVKSLSRVRLLATPWTAAYQAPPSMGFSKQEYWSGVPLPSLSISSSSEYSGLISLRIDRFDLLAVQGALKSLLQHHSSKASILWCSAFFIVQLSHPYVTTGKTIALITWTFASKVMSLLFNMLSWS